MRTFQILSVFAVSTILSIAALAAPPEVPSLPPYIVLSDNLDEPNDYGFCIDTMSRGLNDLMQSHTCKPAREGAERNSPDNDVRLCTTLIPCRLHPMHMKDYVCRHC